MDYNVTIADMHVGQKLDGFYILNDPAVKTTSAGKPFLVGKLSDSSGSIELKMWDNIDSVPAAGSIVKVRGEVSEFKGSLQFTIAQIRLAVQGQDTFDVSSLVPCAPIDADHTFSDVCSILGTMADSDYRRICETMLERHGHSFLTIPAAKSVHHSFLNGLLMHTANMMRLADFLARQYSEVIDRDLLLAGTFLHDFAKEKEFDFSSLGLVTDYSVKGNLLGHLVMGAQEISDIARELQIPEHKSVLLQHMILSHHGQPEFGAAVVPKCAESELLSLIDMIDSRMEIYEEVFRDVPAGQFSSRIFALEKSIYHHD